MKIPFGIAQTGKAFRNEIVARQPFSGCVNSNKWKCNSSSAPAPSAEWYNYWKETRKKWHESIGIPADKLRYHNHTKLAHYADAALDIEFEFPFGWKELEGIHSRTPISICRSMPASAAKKSSISITTWMKMANHMVTTHPLLWKLRLGSTACSSPSSAWLMPKRNGPKKTEQKTAALVLRIPAKIAPPNWPSCH